MAALGLLVKKCVTISGRNPPIINSIVHSNKGRVFCGHRTFLSDSYSCEDAWKKRLTEPVIQETKKSNYYNELQTQFQLNKRISAVDLDLFAHGVEDSEQLNELEELVHQFRRTPNTVHILASTSHAVIRSFLQFGQYDVLLRMLGDRLNYGIFPEHYDYTLMMDTFLKQTNYRDATKVAVLMMLQEDFSHPISKHMALYSCLKFLQNPQPEPWDTDLTPPPEEETDEEVIIRLNYLPPNYFDDHFDLKERSKLLGKTLTMVGREFPDNIGNTCRLIGFTMHEKWSKLKQLLEQIIHEDQPKIIFKESLSHVRESMKNIMTENQSHEEEIRQLQPLIEQLEARTIDQDIVEEVGSRLRDVITSHEQADIDVQLQRYEEWARIRQREVDQQVENYVRSVRIRKLNEMKEELNKRAQLLFFFENFEKHAIKAEEYDRVAQEVTATISKQDEDSYVPPEVRKILPTKQ